MRRCLRVLSAVLLLSGCTTAAVDPPLHGQAMLRDKSGQQVGTATLTESADGVRIQVTASGLPPGPKGLHVHAAGRCDPPRSEERRVGKECRSRWWPQHRTD